MTDYTGYYDTGGNELRGEVIVTAGVVASVEDWNTFDRRWLDVLRRYAISSFHMEPIAHWHKSSDIAKWPLVDGARDEARRRAMFRELLETARGVIRQAFVRAVVLGDYRAVDAEYQLTETVGGPYTLAQAACLLQSQTWLQKQHEQPAKHRWRAIVERGDAGQPEFRRFCEKYLVYTPDFVAKRDESGEDITPLSLADLLAYEHHHLYTRVAYARLAGTQAPTRNEWRGLFRAARELLSVDARIIELGFLERLCGRLRISRR